MARKMVAVKEMTHRVLRIEAAKQGKTIDEYIRDLIGEEKFQEITREVYNLEQYEDTPRKTSEEGTQ